MQDNPPATERSEEFELIARALRLVAALMLGDTLSRCHAEV